MEIKDQSPGHKDSHSDSRSSVTPSRVPRFLLGVSTRHFDHQILFSSRSAHTVHGDTSWWSMAAISFNLSVFTIRSFGRSETSSCLGQDFSQFRFDFDVILAFHILNIDVVFIVVLHWHVRVGTRSRISCVSDSVLPQIEIHQSQRLSSFVVTHGGLCWNEYTKILHFSNPTYTHFAMNVRMFLSWSRNNVKQNLRTRSGKIE